MPSDSQNISQIKEFDKLDLDFLRHNYKNIIESSNNSKLEVLFSNWLESFYYLTKNKSLLKFINLDSTNNLDLFQIIEEKLSTVNKIEVTREVKLKKLKQIFGRLYLFFTDKIYLPGSDYLVSKVKFKLSQFAIIYLEEFVENDLETEIKFKKIISSMNIDKVDLNLLLNLLPSNFFLKKIKSSRSIHLIGSPISLRNNYFMKLLFVSDNIRLSGIQHGCNYGIYKFNGFEKFERDISDQFYLWLISPLNVKISRYNNSKLVLQKKKINIFWIGRPVLNKYFLAQIPALQQITEKEDLKVAKLLFDTVNKFEFKLIPHLHPNSSNIYNFISDKFFYRPSISVEKFLHNGSNLLCFDTISSTLIYYAISSNTPFIILTNDIIYKFKGQFYNDYIKILKEINSIFFVNEYYEFQLEFKKLIICREYYNERIKLINSIKTKIYQESTKI